MMSAIGTSSGDSTAAAIQTTADIFETAETSSWIRVIVASSSTPLRGTVPGGTVRASWPRNASTTRSGSGVGGALVAPLPVNAACSITAVRSGSNQRPMRGPCASKASSSTAGTATPARRAGSRLGSNSASCSPISFPAAPTQTTIVGRKCNGMTVLTSSLYFPLSTNRSSHFYWSIDLLDIRWLIAPIAREQSTGAAALVWRAMILRARWAGCAIAPTTRDARQWVAIDTSAIGPIRAIRAIGAVRHVAAHPLWAIACAAMDIADDPLWQITALRVAQRLTTHHQPLHLTTAKDRSIGAAIDTCCDPQPGILVLQKLAHAAVDFLEIVRNRAQADAVLAIIELHAMRVYCLREHRRGPLAGDGADTVACALQDALLRAVAPVHAKIEASAEIGRAAGPELILESHQLACQPTDMLEMRIQHILHLHIFALILVDTAGAHQIEEVHTIELR